MEEALLEDGMSDHSVPLCKRAGCGKAAWPGKAYCSRECAPHAHLLEGHDTYRRPDTQSLEIVERTCAQNCGKTFRVMASSKQLYCSSLCQSLAEGADPFKGPDWHGVGAVKKPPSADHEEENTEMPQNAKCVETAADLARALGLENYKIYHAIKTGRVKKGHDGFDVAEARLALGGKPPRKAREPRGTRANGHAEPAAVPAAAVQNVTPIRPELAAVPNVAQATPSLEAIRRKAFDAAVAKFRAVLLEESDRLESTGDLRTQNALLKDCIRAETRFQRCFDPEAA